jgi:hypothetical protein
MIQHHTWEEILSITDTVSGNGIYGVAERFISSFLDFGCFGYPSVKKSPHIAYIVFAFKHFQNESSASIPDGITDTIFFVDLRELKNPAHREIFVSIFKGVFSNLNEGECTEVAS